MARHKARTKSGRRTRVRWTPKHYLMPGLRVSVVWEGSVRTRQRPVIKNIGELSAALDSCIPEDAAREHFVMVMLDVRKRLIGVHTVALGCLTGCIVHPRDVFRVAILAGSCWVGFGHNHPSGDAEPSQEDVALTKRLVGVADALGIGVADHIIFGEGMRWVSLRERGLLKPTSTDSATAWARTAVAAYPTSAAGAHAHHTRNGANPRRRVSTASHS